MTLLQANRNRIAQRLAERKNRPSLITPDPEARYKPFPLSDMQYAYWIGRDSALEDGGAIQFYLEIRTTHLNLNRFESAWNVLIRRHEMLRVIVTDDGQQRVLSEVPYQSIIFEDISGKNRSEQEAILLKKRTILQKDTADLKQWPQSHIYFTQTHKDGSGHLHMKIDIWSTDWWSVQIMFDDLTAFYEDPHLTKPTPEISFRDYMLAVRNFEKTPEWQKSFAWWQNRLRHFPPPPPLPTRRQGPSHELQSFVHFEGSLNADQMQCLRTQAAKRGLTIASVVLTAYAHVLGRWSGVDHFTLSVPRFNRPNWHKDIDKIVGEFASFNLLEVLMHPAESFEQQAHAIQKQMWQDLEHQAVSGVRQLREYARHRGTMEVGAMPIVFTMLPGQRTDSPEDMTQRLALFGDCVQRVIRTPQVWIDCQYGESNNALFYNWDAMESLFPPQLVRTMFDAFSSLLKQLSTREELWNASALLDLPTTQHVCRKKVNATDHAILEVTPLARFMQHVEKNPEKIAIMDATGIVLDYQSLASQAAMIAEHLEKRSIKPNDRIALALAKGWRQPAAALAAHMMGCAYIPIDPTHPPQRIAHILSVAQPALVITDRVLAEESGVSTPLILEASPSNTLRPMPKLPPYDPDTLFCIIFTSGTTGQPKGAMITTGGISNALQFSERHFRITDQDCFLAITGWHHDMSLFDIFGSLTAGATVVFPDPQRDIDPKHWLELLEKHGVTLWNSVPRFMEMLTHEAERCSVKLPPQLRQVILGGDWIPTTLPHRLRTLQPNIHVTSVGGPTETTLWNIFHNAFERPEDCPSIPYGKPIDNCRYYILDSALRDCPDWMPGEMYCSGAGISPGYFGDSTTLTHEKFIFHPQKKERLYRTGDRGCYHPDGTIEFLGRCDFQINLGGYRADTMEIEKVLESCPAIQDGIVVSHISGQNSAQLVAFFRTPHDTVRPEDLRTWCEKRLPAPLVPRRFQKIEQYPLNANGKVDRLKLAMQPLHLEEKFQERAPETPLEQFVASLWQDVLGQPVAHVGANYFELGGDSLKAMALFLKIEETLGIRPPLSLIFTRSTVESFAHGILEIISARTVAQ